MSVAESADSLIDKAAVLKWTNGDVEFLAEMVEMFCADCPALLDQLAIAVAQGKPADVNRDAHSVKGVIGTFSTKAPHRLARELEEMGAQNNLEGAANTFHALRVAANELMDEMKSWLSTMANSTALEAV